jgi:glutaredoxin-like protein
VSILREQDREAVRAQLNSITHRVTLVLFTQTIGAPESAFVAKQVVGELAGLSDLVNVEEVNFILERDRATQLGISHIPGIALLRDGADTRMRFLGAPTGYEFGSLVQAVLLAGSDDSGLLPKNKRRLARKIVEAVDIKVFVTSTCSHCPLAVTLAHRVARENLLVTATCVEATEFHDLSRLHRVTGVPKTIATSMSGAITEIMGALPEDQFVWMLTGDDRTPRTG